MRRWLPELPGWRRPLAEASTRTVVHAENKWKLLRYWPGRRGTQHRTPVVLVPSLINRAYILDLLPRRSFARWFSERGHDVYLVDWGTPGPEDRHLTFEHFCDRYLGRAVRKAAAMSGVERVHLLGYCLGGTLTAIHAAMYPERIASLVALAAPIDFDHGGRLTTWTRTRSFDPARFVEAFGNMPWPLMQAAFHLLAPATPFAKLQRLLERWRDDEFLEGFFATERWGSDNVSFPGACFARYIEGLYRDNALVRGRFDVGGRPVDLHRLVAPTMVVAFEHDHIVPPRSATELLSYVGSKRTEQVMLTGSHVGGVVSRKGEEQLWPRLSKWWVEHEAVQPPAEPPRRRIRPKIAAVPEPEPVLTV